MNDEMIEGPLPWITIHQGNDEMIDDSQSNKHDRKRFEQCLKIIEELNTKLREETLASEEMLLKEREQQLKTDLRSKIGNETKGQRKILKDISFNENENTVSLMNDNIETNRSDSETNFLVKLKRNNGTSEQENENAFTFLNGNSETNRSKNVRTFQGRTRFNKNIKDTTGQDENKMVISCSEDDYKNRNKENNKRKTERLSLSGILFGIAMFQNGNLTRSDSEILVEKSPKRKDNDDIKPQLKKLKTATGGSDKNVIMTAKSERVICQMCIQQYVAEMFCKTCQKMICKTCEQRHQIMWSLMFHTICEIE